jgi:CO/xanthine dehydrogenase Mo-binding subunit
VHLERDPSGRAEEVLLDRLRVVGAFVVESAMDELAYELGVDPIELRLRNEPGTDESTGLPYAAAARVLRGGRPRIRLAAPQSGAALHDGR